MLQQLSPHDASFLYQESPTTPMHVGSIAILDPSCSPHGTLSLESVMRFYDQRLHLMPSARRRLVRVPFGLDHPYWIEDPDFDLEYHIREVGLPEPHDWRQFDTLGARLLSRPLDLRRPPWEVYIIHGLDRLEGIPAGCVGLLTKTHHCAIDGASGNEMAMAMADLTPEMAPVPPPRNPWTPDPVPGDIDLVLRSYGNNLLRPLQLAELITRGAPAAQGLSEDLRQELPEQTAIPRTRFNRPVTAHRVIGFERFNLDEVRAMKSEVEGATVNDLALAVCGGAIRGYLRAKFELPDESMVTMVPVNVRKEGADFAMGNQVSAMFIAFGTQIADPVERLKFVRDNTSAAKQISNAVGADAMTRYGEFVPAALANLGQRLTVEFSRANRVTPAFNCSITNVPGPQVPLYIMGCRAITTIGYGPVTHNMGLIIPIGSYCGEFVVSFTSCREMIPDPDFFSECIREAFADMKSATLGADADAKVAVIARNYEQMAEVAIAEVRAARENVLART